MGLNHEKLTFADLKPEHIGKIVEAQSADKDPLGIVRGALQSVTHYGRRYDNSTSGMFEQRTELVISVFDEGVKVDANSRTWVYIVTRTDE